MTSSWGLSWRRATTIALACEAVAVAAWLVPASVHIVSWPSQGPERIALVASRASLTWLVAGGLAVALALMFWESQRARPIGRLTPLALFWLWAVPYLPWIPDRIPLLLVLAGPARWGVAAVAVAAATGLDGRVQRALENEKRLPGRWAIFAISLVLYLAFGLYSASRLGPGGDEPHYLIISQSLLADGDLQIENNHQQREYQSFFAGELRPDYLARGANGAIYSVHAPGLPALLLPVYAVAGYFGSVVLMCLFGALAAQAIFDLADALAGRRAAFLTWMAACFTIPFVPYSWLIFPEVVGALLVAWAALWLWRALEPWSAATWVWRGSALAILPWLHTKFSVLLGVFASAIFLRLWRRPKNAAAFSAPIAVSLVAWFAFFYVVYGSLSPTAPYGDYRAYNILPANIPRGVLGLLFDQKFGLLFYSPVYLFAVAGSWIMVRRRDLRLLGAALIAATALFVGTTTELYMWWGGNSAPARFLVPLVPCLAPMLALAIAATRRAWARALLGAWVALGLAVAIAGAAWPGRFLIFSEPHGRARLLQIFEAGSPLALSYPTFTELDWRSPLLDLVPWLGAAGVGLAVIVTVARWRRTSALWLATVGGLATLTTAGVVAHRTPELRSQTAERGATDVMNRYDPGRLRAFNLSQLRRADPRQVLTLSVIDVVPSRPQQSGTQAALAGPFALPPGSYEARVWFTGTRSREGTLSVSSPPATVFGRVSGPLGNPAIVSFTLPVRARQVSVRVEGDAAQAGVGHVEIAPISIVPASQRPAIAVRAIESIEDRPGGYLVYADGLAYPEGGVFWTRGTSRPTVFVAPGGASRAVLTLFAGPAGSDVDLTLGGVTRHVTVPAGSTLDVEMPIESSSPLVPLEVQAASAHRPSQVDPASSDERLLGCQVRVQLR